MDDLKVQRYSTEIKVYIAATFILAALIVGLVWWNAAQDAEREAQLQSLYASYEDLGRHIRENIDINNIDVCVAPSKTAMAANEETPEDLTPEEQQQLADEQTRQQNERNNKVKTFTTQLSKQVSYLTSNRPNNINPELMNDALLFRLNKTYNEFTGALQKLGERCGDLSGEQVKMRKRRFEKTFSRFNANLKDVSASAN